MHVSAKGRHTGKLIQMPTVAFGMRTVKVLYICTHADTQTSRSHVRLLKSLRWPKLRSDVGKADVFPSFMGCALNFYG